MEKLPTESAGGYLLNTYVIVCFSPLENNVVDKYKLYVFNKNISFIVPTSQIIIKNMFINKDVDGEKKYLFFWHVNMVLLMIF